MTNYERNKSIAELLGLNICERQSENGEVYIDPRDMTIIIHEDLGQHGIYHTSEEEIYTVDYCNNWNDLMPLVIEHGITLYKYMAGSGWQAFVGTLSNIEISVLNINPKRALAECLLKILQEKAKENNNDK